MTHMLSDPPFTKTCDFEIFNIFNMYTCFQMSVLILTDLLHDRVEQ
jgi:lipoprotein signal peptidase